MDELNPAGAAQLLMRARQDNMPADWRAILPADKAAAYAIQDATVQALGPVGGWKVGAKSLELEPNCAPLPRRGLLASGAELRGAQWAMRGVELEVALRIGRDFEADTPPPLAVLHSIVDCVLPAIEVVETRLAGWRESDPLASLADLQTHGALVLGEPSSTRVADIDLRTIEAYLAFDGQPVANARGGNPAGDLWRLLGWLAVHATRRGTPLRAGQVVTTGSCTGMLFATAGARVAGELKGIGRVDLRF